MVSPIEHITAGVVLTLDPPAAGVAIRVLASADCGARGLCTAVATLDCAAELGYHEHDCSEAITVMEGEATILVEGRAYRLEHLDCAHIPAGRAHAVRNESATETLLVHSAFGSGTPARTFVDLNIPRQDRGRNDPQPGDPETIRRFAKCEVYELSPGAFFTDLFARRFGAVGICGGYGRFAPGSSLPCHTHEYDESITIVTGAATCLVKGREYPISGLETALVPRHRPHRFLNRSGSEMAMIWVYAGDEPDRVIVDAGYCSGAMSWPERAE